MRIETLVESQSHRIRLSPSEATALQAAGRQLASNTTWGDDEPRSDRTAIRCTPAGGDLWDVRVSDAIGVVAIDSVQLVVQPKIPLHHLLYLFAQSGLFPRLQPQHATTSPGESFWELVAAWFVLATEHLLRGELIRDYHLHVDEVPAAVGHVLPTPTARAYYTGRLRLTCEFDEFGINNPLNRVIRAAAQIVASSHRLESSLRRRALRILARMHDVGEWRHDDLYTRLERRSQHYRDAFCLAGHVIRALGRALVHGDHLAWTFLVRTPTMVEEGVRRVLQRHFGAERIQKYGRRLRATTMTLTPDLVIDDGAAVADVKYKCAMGAWNRADMFEVNAFATEFRTSRALIIDFQTSTETTALSPIAIGDTVISHLPWEASLDRSSDEAATMLCDKFERWMNIQSR